MSFSVLRDPRVWAACVAFGIAAWLIVPQVVGGRLPTVRAEDLPEADFICRETREVFRLPATASVLPNPQTGRLTLVPAVFDPKTKGWRPGPPLDVRQRARRRPAR
jgi:hypothetical protein